MLSKNADGKWVYTVEGVEFDLETHTTDDMLYVKILPSADMDKRVVVVYSKAEGKVFAREIASELFDKSFFNDRLTPVQPPKPFFHNFKVDDKIFVRNDSKSEWYPRYFHSVSSNGRVCAFQGGCTSFSAFKGRTRSWYQAKHPETGEVWVWDGNGSGDGNDNVKG